ncbi:MAG: peptidase M50 [Mycobacterium sp.]|uniref:peptidase M50 n=1 Tax=Mycobacterium sp. TaxID=1785 RepID=UPI003F9C1AF3
MSDADIAVLVFGGGSARRRCGPRNGQRRRRASGPVPHPLRGLAVVDPGDIDAAIAWARRLVVVGADADLATVLTLLLRAERLDVEVAYVPRRRTPPPRVPGGPGGRRAARRAQRGSAQRVPLIRDETGSAVVGAAHWRPTGDAQLLHGEAVVDDAVLFDGDVAGVRVEPTAALPGLRARVSGSRSRRWLTGRAAQLGSNGVAVVRDGVAAPRTARRSTIYRNTEGWLLVK